MAYGACICKIQSFVTQKNVSNCQNSKWERVGKMGYIALLILTRNIQVRLLIFYILESKRGASISPNPRLDPILPNILRLQSQFFGGFVILV